MSAPLDNGQCRHRFQFVWFWPLSEWQLAGKHQFEGSYRHIYRWVVTIGPLEIRRWA